MERESEIFSIEGRSPSPKVRRDRIFHFVSFHLEKNAARERERGARTHAATRVRESLSSYLREGKNKTLEIVACTCARDITQHTRKRT